MAETVGQHSVAAFTSPVNGTTPIDANTVRGNDNTVRSAYVDHDADPGIHVQSSSLASRPVAGTAGRKWITVSSGRYQLWYDDGSRWNEVASDAINVDCLADANLTKGDVVKITGFNNGQNLPTVNKVTASTDTAFGVVENTVTSGNLVQIVNTGLIEDVDTNGYAVGTILYPNTSGGWTTTKPTSGNYQPAGYVLRGNTNNGVLYVEFSAPRIVERSDNTASTIVLRDASGNFSAGTITAGALTSTGLVTFASLKGTGATTVTNILDEDNMASDSATALATQQSIKAYVDAQVATVDTLAEVLANGNTTGANDIVVNSGQKIRTPLVAAQDGTSAITIANSTGALTLNTALADSNLATISTAGKVANSATTATSANTASAIVARDASGNFSAGTITAALTGNASTATALQTARTINGTSFDGTANITVTAAAGTLTGTTLASNVVSSSLTSVGTLANLTVTNPITGSVTGSSGSTTGNAATATALQTARNINGVSFNGTADITVTAAAGTLSGSTLASGVTASSLTSVGTLTSLTVSGATNLATTSAATKIGLGTASPDASYKVTISGNSGTTTPGIFFDDQAASPKNYVLYTNGSKNFVLRNQTDAINIFEATSAGNLGLGVTPSAWGTANSERALQLNAGSVWSYSTFGLGLLNNAFYDSAGNYKYIRSAFALDYFQSSSSGAHLWRVAPSGTAGNTVSFTTAMTLDASGNLGVGTTSPSGKLSVSGFQTASGLDNVSATFSDAANSTVVITHAGGKASLGTDGAQALCFLTNKTERARITSGGYFKASNDGTYSNATGTAHELRSTQSNDYVLRMDNTSASPFGSLWKFSGASPDNNTNYFLECGDSTTVRCYIWSDGDLANHDGVYGTISDERLKQDIVDAGSQWDDLKAVRFRKYRMKTDVEANPDAPYLLGVVAQELEQTSPGLVDEHPDFEEQEVTDEDGNVTTEKVQVGTTKTVKSSILLMKAAVALQEAMARIETLEAHSAALEARLEALEA